MYANASGLNKGATGIAVGVAVAANTINTTTQAYIEASTLIYDVALSDGRKLGPTGPSGGSGCGLHAPIAPSALPRMPGHIARMGVEEPTPVRLALVVVVEAAAHWTTPLDTQVESLGGVVLRRARTGVVDEQVERLTAQPGQPGEKEYMAGKAA